MDPPEASVAIELLGVKRVLPCHYGTFPLLAGTPEQLDAGGAEIHAIQPGESLTV
jgi:L-ascorbate metabolism protein UlaG (beta-lactamase superfamily)